MMVVQVIFVLPSPISPGQPNRAVRTRMLRGVGGGSREQWHSFKIWHHSFKKLALHSYATWAQLLALLPRLSSFSLGTT